MGYGSNGLTFNTLRRANIERLKESFPTCRDWTPAQWLQALIGEVGEYANFRKKFERGDMPEDVFKSVAAKELGDIQCYLDLLALSLNINLGEETTDKFNEVSGRVNSRVYIGSDGDWHLRAIK